MRSLYTKLIVTLGLSTALAVPMARAEIPFTQARGMYEQTKDDKKNISPFWGMVAIHGKMLERIRFYGNYASVPNPEAGGDDAENIRTVDQGKDPIAALIKRLFNSPDGVQFVATTYEADPVGNLSRNLPAINDIIEILLTVTETPRKIAAITKIINGITPDPNTLNEQVLQKKIVSQLESQLKINRKKFVEEKMQQRMKGIETNKNNLERGELQKLKLVKEADLINIARENNIALKDNLKPDDISRLRQQISNKIVKDLISEHKTNVLKEFFDEIGLFFNSDLTNSELIDLYVTKAIKPELERAIATFQRETILPIVQEQLEKENVDFAKLLVEAYDAQIKFADPSIPDKYLYPENVVITALLGFFVKVANDASQLRPLTYLMEPTYEGAVDIFDKKKYKTLKKEYLEGKEMPNLEILKNPETAFLMAKGYTAYEYPYAEPIPYTRDTFYGNGSFPDCGETSLRNVLGLFLSANNQSKISPEAIKSLLAKIQSTDNSHLQSGSPFQNMIAFFNTFPDMTVGGVQKIHNAWAQVVSDLNNGMKVNSLNDVYYGLSSRENGPRNYEIKSALRDIHDKVIPTSGIINMLNVIGKLIPDERLNEPWAIKRKQRFKQISKKLTRFCELLSRDGLSISWVNKESDDQDINGEFLDITFKINEIPIFNWQFIEGHFQLATLHIDANDWRLAYRSEEIFTPANFPNEWMASLFRSFKHTYHKENGNFSKYFILSLIYNPDLKNYDGADSTIEWVLNNNLIAYKPLIIRWIQKSIPLNDQHARQHLWLTLTSKNNAIDIIEKLLNMDEVKKELSEMLTDGLVQATKTGQIKMMEFLLRKGGSINGEENKIDTDTPMIAAIKNGQREAILFLLKGGAKMNKALTMVIEQNNQNILEFLLSNGIDINMKTNHRDDTPLIEATESGKEAIVKLLLDIPGIEINAENSNGTSSLKAAVSKGHENIVKLLLADPRIKYNPEELKKWISERSTEELTKSAKNGEMERIDSLLKQGASIDGSRDEYEEETPLIGAINDKQIKAILFLLEKGADVNATNGQESEYVGNVTPLQLAVRKGSEDIINILIDHGADVNAINAQGMSPLQEAVSGGNEKIVKLLITDPGIKYNPEDLTKWKNEFAHQQNAYLSDSEEDSSEGGNYYHGGGGNSSDEDYGGGGYDSEEDYSSDEDAGNPLLEAVIMNDESTIKRLLEIPETDINSVGGGYSSPLEAAALKGYENIVNLLLADPRLEYKPEDLEKWRLEWKTEELVNASKNGKIDEMASLLQQGALINGTQKEYNNITTPLIGAINNGQIGAASFLLQNKADVNAVSQTYSENYGDTPLHAAALKGNEDLVVFLIKSKADINRKSLMNGATPLIRAIQGKNPKIIDLLIQHGAKIVLDKEETSPLLVAVEQGDENTIKLLISKGIDANHGDQYGKTPLFEAVQSNNEPMVKLLLQAPGVDVNAVYYNESPLETAARRGYEAIAELLLAAPGIQYTPEDLAKWRYEFKNPEVYQYSDSESED